MARLGNFDQRLSDLWPTASARSADLRTARDVPTAPHAVPVRLRECRVLDAIARLALRSRAASGPAAASATAGECWQSGRVEGRVEGIREGAQSESQSGATGGGDSLVQRSGRLG